MVFSSMGRYVQKLDKGVLNGPVPECPCIVGVPCVNHGLEVMLYQLKLSVNVVVKALQEGFPKIAARSGVAVSRQAMFKVVGELLGHAFGDFIVLRGGVDFSRELDSESGMYIEMVMFDVKAVDEGEEKRVSDDNISSVVDEGVGRSASSLVVNPSPQRRFSSEVSPSVVRV